MGVLLSFFLEGDKGGDDNRDGKGESYELIGECYAQGMMYGAAIEEWERGERPVERFVLV